MAEYKTIKGFKTQSYATDPAPATAAWSSGPTLNTGRQGNSASGLQTAALTMGGIPPPSGLTKTESYNGSAWTEVNAMLTGRSDFSSNGIQTAAISIGGYPSTSNVETWDGTCWSEVNNLT